MGANISVPMAKQLMRTMNLLPTGAASLLSLVDLPTLTTRAASTGLPALLESLIICPGLHKLQEASELNKAEYPACAAMTTGYVFRVENEATVFQLQRLGRPGHLTTLRVSSEEEPEALSWDIGLLTNVLLTAVTAFQLLAFKDYRALIALSTLLLIRTLNILIFRRRSLKSWKGVSEPGVQADLIVLLSQDKWIRIRGLVDDVKAVTAGQWLRDMTAMESSLVACGKLLLYFNAAVMWEVSQMGQGMLVMLLLCGTGWAGWGNLRITRVFRMCGRSVRVEGGSKAYRRRLDLAEELVGESGREDWAVRLGMIQPRSNDMKGESELGPKIM